MQVSFFERIGQKVELHLAEKPFLQNCSDRSVLLVLHKENWECVYTTLVEPCRRKWLMSDWQELITVNGLLATAVFCFDFLTGSLPQLEIGGSVEELLQVHLLPAGSKLETVKLG